MDMNAFECVWNGTDGWIGRPELGRGTLLPPHESQTALGAAVAAGGTGGDGSRPGLRRPRPLGKRKYHQALREVVRALRVDGLTLVEISRRLTMPVGTVYHILKEGRPAR